MLTRRKLLTGAVLFAPMAPAIVGRARASGLTPGGFVHRSRTVRPPGKPIIDWSHPWTANLVEAYAPDASTVYSLVGKTAPLVSTIIIGTGAVDIYPTPSIGGTGLFSNAFEEAQTGKTICNNGGGCAFSGCSGSTTLQMFWVATLGNTFASQQVCGGYLGSTPTSSRFRIGLTPTDVTPPYPAAISGASRMGGTANVLESNWSPNLWEPVVIAFTTNWVGDSGRENLYWLGGSPAKITETYGSPLGVPTFDTMSMMARSDAGEPLGGGCIVAYFWNTILSDQQIFSMLANPFDFLIFPRDRVAVNLRHQSTAVLGNGGGRRGVLH